MKTYVPLAGCNRAGVLHDRECSLKWVIQVLLSDYEFFYSTPGRDGSTSHSDPSTPAKHLPVAICIPRQSEILWDVIVLLNSKTTWPRPGLKLVPLNVESSERTIKLPRLPILQEKRLISLEKPISRKSFPGPLILPSQGAVRLEAPGTRVSDEWLLIKLSSCSLAARLTWCFFHRLSRSCARA